MRNWHKSPASVKREKWQKTASLPPSLGQIIKAVLHLGATANGGLAMVEPIRRRLVQEKGWLSQQEFLDGLALIVWRVNLLWIVAAAAVISLLIF
jgi:hypothetical protein